MCIPDACYTVMIYMCDVTRFRPVMKYDLISLIWSNLQDQSVTVLTGLHCTNMYLPILKPAWFITVPSLVSCKSSVQIGFGRNVCLKLSFGMQIIMLPFMALIFSYPCPGGGRKNGDTIALLSV